MIQNIIAMDNVKCERQKCYICVKRTVVTLFVIMYSGSSIIWTSLDKTVQNSLDKQMANYEWILFVSVQYWSNVILNCIMVVLVYG